MNIIQIGPAVLPVERLIALCGLAAFVISGRLLRRRHPEVAESETGVLIAGLTVSRLIFVLFHWDAYLAAPATVLFIWQGGFSVTGAILGAVTWATWIHLRKRPLLPLGLVPILAGILVWAVPTLAMSRPEQEKPQLPEITLVDLSGAPVDLGGYRGKPVVINLWATWCGPCRREMPMLEGVVQEEPDIVFLFANQGERETAVTQYLIDAGLSLPNVLIDTGSRLSRHLGARGLPTTLFYAPSGHLVDAHVGEISRAALSGWNPPRSQP